MARFGKGLRPALQDQRILPCGKEPGPVSWKAPLETLKEALPEWLQGGADATVILSGHFVRYALAPWLAEVTADNERETLARHIFTGVYGGAAADWAIRISDAKYGFPFLASAVDHALLHELQALQAPGKFKLRSIQPYFMTAFNEFRSRLGEDGCFILAEPGKLCASFFHQGKWQNIVSRRFESDADLISLALREINSAELPAMPERIFLYAPQHPDLKWPDAGIAPIEYLHLSWTTQAEYAMALCGGN